MVKLNPFAKKDKEGKKGAQAPAGAPETSQKPPEGAQGGNTPPAAEKALEGQAAPQGAPSAQAPATSRKPGSLEYVVKKAFRHGKLVYQSPEHITEADIKKDGLEKRIPELVRFRYLRPVLPPIAAKKGK